MRFTIFFFCCCSFLVVHLLGNLSALAGKDAFNGYADALARNPLLKFIEVYLLLAGVAHAVAGLLISWRKRSFIAKAPVERGMLLFTSLVSLLFIIVHLTHFRLSEMSWSNGTLQGFALEANRDLFTQTQILLANPTTALFYCVGVIAILWHVYIGWERAVKKIDLPAASVPLALSVGSTAVFILCLGFLCVIGFFYSGSPSLFYIYCCCLSMVDDNNLGVSNIFIGAIIGVLCSRLLGPNPQTKSSQKPYGEGILLFLQIFLFN